MLSEAFLHRLDTLRPALRSRARGGSGGARKSRMLGTSAEFSDFREYAPGDDIRRIDWNAYARFDKLFLKLFMEEQEAMITVLLDGSASMAEKWPAAQSIAEAFAYAALGGGDRVRAAIATKDGPVSCAFGTGRRDYPRLSAYIADYSPKGQADLALSIRRLDPCPKGMTLLISDFLVEDAGNAALAALRYRGQETCAVQVMSPEELRPAFSGSVRLTDEEGGTPLDLSADGETLRQYEKRLNEFLQQVQGNCHRQNVPCVLLDSGESIEDTLIRAFLKADILS
ncbi:MAG: DUF58 domain-containing protein [Clostridia bacterium]|nr:DUF58 domain-containing protein [Clostridia bacterium]